MLLRSRRVAVGVSIGVLLVDAGKQFDGPASGYLVFDCALRWAVCGREMTDGFLAAAVSAGRGWPWPLGRRAWVPGGRWWR